MKSLLITLLAVAAHSADTDGMLRDYSTALEKRAALDLELERRITLFEAEVSGLEKNLHRDGEAAAIQCAKAEEEGARLTRAADALATIGAQFALRLENFPKKTCGGYAVRRAESLLAASTAGAAEITPLLSEAKSIARTRLHSRAAAQAIAAPWDQRPGRLALVSDQAESLRLLFEEARQRSHAARVTRSEIKRLSDKGVAAADPDSSIDYAARERDAITKPFSMLVSKIRTLNCNASLAPTAAHLDASADAALEAFQTLLARVRRCRAEAAAALQAELEHAPQTAEEARLEETAYETQRQKHLARDLEEWKRRSKREARRLAQQRRFAKRMRPPRRRKNAKGTGRKGPWLAWGLQLESDAPIRLRITDVDQFEENEAPYKRILRARLFRSSRAAQQWVCERLAGIRERPVVGRSAEFGDEIVGLGKEIRCD